MPGCIVSYQHSVSETAHRQATGQAHLAPVKWHNAMELETIRLKLRKYTRDRRQSWSRSRIRPEMRSKDNVLSSERSACSVTSTQDDPVSQDLSEAWGSGSDQHCDSPRQHLGLWRWGDLGRQITHLGSRQSRALKVGLCDKSCPDPNCQRTLFSVAHKMKA